MQTLEQRIKRALPIGCHLAAITHGDQRLLVLVDITPRGAVSILIEPDDSAMYSSWRRIKGDTYQCSGAIIVWGARDSVLRARFVGAPFAVISVLDEKAAP